MACLRSTPWTQGQAVTVQRPMQLPPLEPDSAQSLPGHHQSAVQATAKEKICDSNSQVMQNAKKSIRT